MTAELTHFVPKNAVDVVLVDARGTDAFVYTYTDERGRPCLIAYHGKSRKADMHYCYTKADQRDARIASFIDGRATRAKVMAERKVERNKPHTLKVGQIMMSSWGYDQTNIEYFEVTKVIGPHTVEIRELNQNGTYDSALMTGVCSPIPGDYKSDAMVKRVSSQNTIRLTSFSSAWVWDGRPRSYSTYA